MQLGQATSQLCQQTGINDVRHRLWLSTGTQVRVNLSPSLPAGTAMTLCSAGETTVVEGGQTWLSDCGVDH